MKRKDPTQSKNSAFQINEKHQQSGQYPLMLAQCLNRAETQVEESRSMRMLGDWAGAYEGMGEVMKLKYGPHLPKVMKILIGKYLARAPIEYCLSRFLLCFYQSWKDMTAILSQQLRRSEKYGLVLLWYTCHNLVEDLNQQKQAPFIDYLSVNYEEGLRVFKPSSHSDFHKLMDMLYFFNIYGCRREFSNHADEWAEKISGIAAHEEGDIRMETTMDILRNSKVLLSGKKSGQFWRDEAMKFFTFMEQKVGQMTNTTEDRYFLNIFMGLLEMREVSQIMQEQQSHFLKHIFTAIRPNPHDDTHIFHQPEFAKISEVLYTIFFRNNKAETDTRLKRILEKFTSHSFSVLNEEDNFVFLDCLTQDKIEVEAAMVSDILKVLNNNHIRRTLPARALLVLAKILTASIQSCEWFEVMVSTCIRSLVESLTHKMADPMIGELRSAYARLFLRLMERNSWNDNSKSVSIFMMCEEYENNNRYGVSSTVIAIISLLVKKFGFAKSNMHKLDPFIKDIQRKIVFDLKNIKAFVSLILNIVEVNSHWPPALEYIGSVCGLSKSPLAPFFSFQAETLVKLHQQEITPQQQAMLETILGQADKWTGGLAKGNLMMIDMFFMKQGVRECMRVLRELDSRLLTLFEYFYEERNFHLLADVAARLLPAAGGHPNLLQLKSYEWIRKFSFDMLARSFYKTTSIAVCNVFSRIILRAEDSKVTAHWLCEEQFLEYLYQGLNDFLSKEKKYTIDLVPSFLAFRLFQEDRQVLPHETKITEFSTLFKNVGWWREAEYEIVFDDVKNEEEWMLPQFKKFYESTVVKYYQDYFKNYEERKARLKREAEEKPDYDDDYY